MKAGWIFLLIFSLGCFALVEAGINSIPKQDYEPGKVIVKFKPEYKNQLPQQPAANFGFAELDRTLVGIGTKQVAHCFQFNPQKHRAGLPDLSLIYQIDYQQDISPYAVAELLMQFTIFDYAEPVFIDEILAVPNDLYYPQSSYLHVMQSEQAWDLHKGEDGAEAIVLAVVDTGVNWKHADLIDNIWHNLGEDFDQDGSTLFYNGSAWVFDPGDVNGIDDDENGYIDDFIGWDFMLTSAGDESNDPIDGSGHGTNVAGLADSRTNNSVGVASLPWNVKLMPISCTFPGSGNLYKSADAFIYAAENGAHVINFSAGSANYSQSYEDAIAYVTGLGTIFVAAAGNNNTSAVFYPAGYPNVLAVAAVLNSGVKAPISSYGAFVDVCAPTDGLYAPSAGGGYNTTTLGNYTSYASPSGAAMSSLIRSAHPNWTNEQVINQLIATCVDIDAINPSYVNMLGDGMLNAYNALSMLNPVPDQGLRLELKEVLPPSDANGNHALEQDEAFSLNLKIRNYAHGVSSDNVTYTLSCSDPDIIILNNSHSGSVPADGYALLTNAFQCRVSPTANTQTVVCTLTVAADLPVIFGSTMTFSILINAGGVFVWEGRAEAGYSGRKIRDTLISQGHPVFYSTTFPTSFHTFSSVFLSFGMATASSSNETRFDRLSMFEAVRDYLLEGGRIYLEGNDAIGFDPGYFMPDLGDGQSAADVLWPLLGIAASDDGSTNPIDQLAGQSLSLTHDITFNSTTQTKLDYIDIFTPTAVAAPAFIESDYGCVAVQNYGSPGHKSFVFSYCLAELVDGTAPNTRDSLIYRIMQDFMTLGNTMQMEVPNVLIERDLNSISLSWDAVPYALSYRIEASDEPESGFTQVGTTDQTSFLQAESAPHRFYRVIACSYDSD